jgi:hypothetical protein
MMVLDSVFQAATQPIHTRFSAPATAGCLLRSYKTSLIFAVAGYMGTGNNHDSAKAFLYVLHAGNIL